MLKGIEGLEGGDKERGQQAWQMRPVVVWVGSRRNQRCRTDGWLIPKIQALKSADAVFDRAASNGAPHRAQTGLPGK